MTLLVVGLLSMAALVAACSGAGTDSSSTGGLAGETGAAEAAGGGDGPAPRYRIRTADVDLAVDEPDGVREAADQVTAVVDEVGGQVDDDRRTYGDDARADLVVRVPPDELEAVIDRFSEIARVTSSSISTEDVTEDYTDLESRIATLEASVERVRSLVGDAGDVVQVAALENELRSRETELELAKGQLRALDEKVQLATVTVGIRTEAESASESAPAPAQAAATGWDAFVGTMSWVLAGLLVSLPFLVLAAVLLVLGRLVRRRFPAKERTRRVPQGWTVVPPGQYPPPPGSGAGGSAPSPGARPAGAATATAERPDVAGDESPSPADDGPAPPT